MKTIPYIIVLGFLFACTNNSNSKKKTETSKEVKQIIQANAQIDLDVEGMVCQMGCGGSMRKELKKTGAVAQVDVQFVEGNISQRVQVLYDSTLISANKISSILNTMNEKQFSTKIVSKKAI
jgi:copper chaperone CopZ